MRALCRSLVHGLEVRVEGGVGERDAGGEGRVLALHVHYRASLLHHFDQARLTARGQTPVRTHAAAASEDVSSGILMSIYETKY